MTERTKRGQEKRREEDNTRQEKTTTQQHNNTDALKDIPTKRFKKRLCFGIFNHKYKSLK